MQGSFMGDPLFFSSSRRLTSACSSSLPAGGADAGPQDRQPPTCAAPHAVGLREQLARRCAARPAAAAVCLSALVARQVPLNVAAILIMIAIINSCLRWPAHQPLISIIIVYTILMMLCL